jgi:hypothetical protein
MQDAAELFPDYKEALSQNDCELALNIFTSKINTEHEKPQTTPEPALPEPETAPTQSEPKKKIDVNTIRNIHEFDQHYKAGEIDANQIEPFLNNNQDPDSYINAIYSFNNIAYAAKTFPAHKELLIQPLLKHTDLLKRMIKSGKDLISLANIFPEHKDAIITPFLNDVDMYNKIIRESMFISNFTLLANAFPDHVEALLSFPEKNPGKYCSSPITEYYELVSALKACPQHQASLLKASLNTKDKLLAGFRKVMPRPQRTINRLSTK